MGPEEEQRQAKGANFHKRKLRFSLIELYEQCEYRFCVLSVMARRTGILELQYRAAIG